MRGPLAVPDPAASVHSLPASAEPDSPEAPTPAAPDPYTPPCRTVRAFPPIRGRRGGGRRCVPHTLRWRRRRLAVGIALAAAVLTVSAAYSPAPAKSLTARSTGTTTRPAVHRPSTATKDPVVKAPVRIADAAAVRLLRPGDHVDVLAAAHVVAAGVTVVDIPEGPEPRAGTTAYVEGALPPGVTDPAGAGGALVVLSVPRHVAAALSGAAASSPLAVALC
jgi:hypothetical protein